MSLIRDRSHGLIYLFCNLAHHGLNKCVAVITLFNLLLAALLNHFCPLLLLKYVVYEHLFML